FAKGKRGIPPGTVQASLIDLDPRNGRILAMVGGRNYGASQFNRITQSNRQPGSIFKPFVYTAALETAYGNAEPLTAVSTVLDEPTSFSFEDLVYEPRNFKDEYLGQVTMRQAISKSLNVATIKLAERVGYPKITELARRLGRGVYAGSALHRLGRVRRQSGDQPFRVPVCAANLDGVHETRRHTISLERRGVHAAGRDRSG